MALAAAIIPIFGSQPLLATSADTIALVGLFAVARVFTALAGMDIGTAFGTLGARREMLIGFLSEPALLMVFFTASLLSQSTLLPTIVETLAHRELAIYPSLAFAGVAFAMVLLAENARMPIDNPSHPPRTDHDPRGDGAGIFGPAPGADRVGLGAEAAQFAAIGMALFVPWGLPRRAAACSRCCSAPAFRC